VNPSERDFSIMRTPETGKLFNVRKVSSSVDTGMHNTEKKSTQNIAEL
jgi:hypothetical protein